MWALICRSTAQQPRVRYARLVDDQRARPSAGGRLRVAALTVVCALVFLALTVVTLGLPLLALLYYGPKELRHWRHGLSHHLVAAHARPADPERDATLIAMVRELAASAGI